jgi:hypothetical protein
MKKLLALVLCVVMVLSLVPAAFAAGTTGGVALATGTQIPNYIDKAVANALIKDLNDDIKALYTATVANETVFSSAKAIYDFSNGLAKELLKDTEKVEFPDGTTLYNEDLTANLRKSLNHFIGNEIRNYMDDRIDAYTNAAGNIQPEKYLNTYVKALNSALASETAQKNIESLVLAIATMSAMQKANDAADDLYDAIVDWDHWNEFNWGDIANMDPSVAANGGYTGTWLPSSTTLIPSGSVDGLVDSIGGRFSLYGWLDNDPVATDGRPNAGNPGVWPQFQ